mmetsp:Transcript_28424/g.85179  ORF Transcript_28424/g.85179 Transcript_28424/m.85179 type:complete len:116 (-) Transcript_28424:1210-1557(-)
MLLYSDERAYTHYSVSSTLLWKEVQLYPPKPQGQHKFAKATPPSPHLVTTGGRPWAQRGYGSSWESTSQIPVSTLLPISKTPQIRRFCVTKKTKGLDSISSSSATSRASKKASPS